MLKAKLKPIGIVTCLMMAMLGASACRQDMHDNPKYKPYREGANRQLPDGVVARGSLDMNPAGPKMTQAAAAVATASTDANAQASTSPTPAAVPQGEDGFPFKLSDDPEQKKKDLMAILNRGENRFNISCLPCHGKLGDGNGMIVQRGFKRPPSYHEARLQNAPSSYFYDVITNGFGQMSNYADQLAPEDRWKVIAYIRVLQLSQRADVNKLAEKEKQEVEAEITEAAKGKQKGGGHGGTTAPASAPASGGHSN
ncbi:MAG: cytochrome c [Acidobacteriota bacterium]